MTCFPLDNTEYTASALGAWFGTRTRGVFSAEEHFTVKATGGLNVNVSGGIAWLKAEEHWGVVVHLPETQQLTVAVADGSLMRWDIVCLRLNKNGNKAELVIKQGGYSQTPEYPKIIRNIDYDEIYLAAIKMRAGSTAVLQSDIVDLRLNEMYCGVMRDGVTGIPTQQLYDQWSSWFSEQDTQAKQILENLNTDITDFLTVSANDFNAWFEEMKNQLGTDAAGNLQNQIDTIKPMVISATGITTGTDSALLLKQEGYTLKDGSIIVMKLHTTINSGVSVTLDINETGAKPVITIDGNTTLPCLFIDSYVTLVYSSTKEMYILQLSASAPSLSTARTIQTNLSSTEGKTFDGTTNIFPGVTGILGISNGGTGNNVGNSVSATKLQTARSITVNLAYTGAVNFDGTQNIVTGVTGILPLAYGGTGRNDGIAASNVKTGIFPELVYAANKDFAGGCMRSIHCQTSTGVDRATSKVVFRSE